MSTDIGRNDPCHCGSKKKYKKCHLEKDSVADAKKREKMAKAAAKEAEKNADKEEKASKKTDNKSNRGVKTWAQKLIGGSGFSRTKTSQRKSPPSNKGG